MSWVWVGPGTAPRGRLAPAPVPVRVVVGRVIGVWLTVGVVAAIKGRLASEH